MYEVESPGIRGTIIVITKPDSGTEDWTDEGQGNEGTESTRCPSFSECPALLSPVPRCPGVAVSL